MKLKNNFLAFNDNSPVIIEPNMRSFALPISKPYICPGYATNISPMMLV